MKSELMELDINDVRKLSLQLAQKVTETPDLVAFVAKGAYLIGLTTAEYFHAPLIEVEAVRSGNRLKKILRPMLTVLPAGVKVWLRNKEINSGIHAQNTERCVAINDPKRLIGENFRSILLVDDSVDTGNTILAVEDALQKAFPQAQILTAAFFVREESKSLVTIDYSLYGDTVFSAPWSNDSRYKKEFMAEYSMMKDKGVF
jgi:hypoxanthine phosphoribosyltransferase